VLDSPPRTAVRPTKLIRTNLQSVRRWVVEKKALRRAEKKLETAPSIGWPKDIALERDRLGALETYCDTPDKVLRSWASAKRVGPECLSEAHPPAAVPNTR
jgi:hypothetical protein